MSRVGWFALAVSTWSLMSTLNRVARPSKKENRAPRTRTVLKHLMKESTSNMASLDWSQCPAVESVPGRVSGAWVLKATRIPVSATFENLEAGASIDDIMEWFDGLDREQVKAVIEFAARSLDKPPEYAR